MCARSLGVVLSRVEPGDVNTRGRGTRKRERAVALHASNSMGKERG